MIAPVPGSKKSNLFFRWFTEGLRPYLLLTIFVFTAFFPVIHSGIFNLDTPWLVVGNPLLNAGDPSSIGPILWDMKTGTRRTLGAEYLPMRDLSVLLDFALFGPNMALHHLSNLLLFLMACWAFLKVSQGIIGPRPLALFAASIYAIHPLNVEPVAWLASRKDVLAVLLFNLAIVFWLKARSEIKWFFASVFLYLLAVWSKSPAIVLPGVLVVVSLILKGDKPGINWLKQWIPFGAVTAMTLAIGLSLGKQLSFFTPPLSESLLGRAFIASRLYVGYLWHFLWPSDLAVWYDPPLDLPLTEPASFGPVILILILISLILILWRSMPLVSGGLAWFMVALIPVSQLIPLQWVSADRYMIIPGMGLSLAAAGLVARLPTSKMPRLLVRSLALAPLLLLGGRSHVLATTWQSSVAVWQRAVDVNPNSVKATSSLIGAHLHEKNVPEALKLARQGILDFPESARMQQVLGGILLKLGETEEAEIALKRSVKMDPKIKERKSYNQLMVLFNRQARFREAAELGDRLVRTHPSYWQGWNSHGVALMGLEDWPGADNALKQAAYLAPNSGTVVCNRGMTAFQLKRYGQARTEWVRCLQLDPGNDNAKIGLEYLGVEVPQ